MKLRVLFIDAYDSFSNNIVSLLEKEAKVHVTVIKIDYKVGDLSSFLQPFAAVVAGPGPGHPANKQDVGLIRDLWTLSNEHLIPVLGICLGFQSLVLAFGGTIERLPHPRHGIERIICSNGGYIFQGYQFISAVQYHSLHALLGHGTSDTPGDHLNITDLWKPTETCPNLQPLAWDCQAWNADIGVQGKDNLNPKCILMAVKHTTKPFYGIQYHPESVSSSLEARQIILAWWESVMTWHQVRRSKDSLPKLPPSVLSNGIPSVRSFLPTPPLSPSSSYYSHHAASDSVPQRTTRSMVWRSLRCENISIPTICNLLGVNINDTIILDSEMRQMSGLGRFSIIGVLLPTTLNLKYVVGSCEVGLEVGPSSSSESLQAYDGNIYTYLEAFMDDNKFQSNHTEIPFWGGLMGYITYEACLETIGIQSTASTIHSQRPDLSFAFVERSIVVDHATQRIYIQSIKSNDQDWVSETHHMLHVHNHDRAREANTLDQSVLRVDIRSTSKGAYEAKVRDCQTLISNGESYELCLTTQATVVSEAIDPWALYLRLRASNPAPFSAYVRLGALSLLSTSPERFMSWTRPIQRTNGDGEDEETSTCQFRPIKGTVKKRRISTDGSSYQTITLAEATEILSTKKERAENLMIVDLIRHDLHGVVGSGNVVVKDLMIVEEYASVYQLVSVIEGSLITSLSRTSSTNSTLRGVRSTSTSPQRYSTTSTSSSLEKFPSTPYSHLSMVDSSSTLQAKTVKASQRVAHGMITCEDLDGEEDSRPGQGPGRIRGSKSGISVLAASLPPGSMTGAPKRRSCALLQGAEDGRRRSVYSGVLGYMDVGGGGDFSVVIRSMWKWDDEHEKGDEAQAHFRGQRDEWHVGAGGAVTTLSTPSGEWEEMSTKMESVLEVFV
ncbi:para-aminobenzoate synthase, (PABA) [Bachmanniomyces sp. S44760]|nr:para-aminobenzoate synthase, (PABA) [Bachmanniomyces sp. S44760]